MSTRWTGSGMVPCFHLIPYFHTVREFDNYMKDGSNGVNVYKILIVKCKASKVIVTA